MLLFERTYQQDSDGHERRSSCGDGAVHQDDVVFADVFGQAKVVKLGGGVNSRVGEIKTKLQPGLAMVGDL